MSKWQKRRKQQQQQQPLRRSPRLLASASKKPKTEEQNSGSKQGNGKKSQLNEFRQKALSNYVVLTQILKNLRPLDLLTCRLVNRQWSNIATSILRNRSDLQLDLRYLKEVNTFVLNRVKLYPLNELTRLLEKSSRFPCTNFNLMGPLSCLDVQEFLTFFGKDFKRLKLNFEYSPYEWRNYSFDPPEPVQQPAPQQQVSGRLRRRYTTKISHFTDLLIYQAPNLQHLFIEKFPSDWTDHENENDNELDNDNEPENNNDPENDLNNDNVNVQRTKLFSTPRSFPSLLSLGFEDAPLKDTEWFWIKEILDSSPNIQSFSLYSSIERSLEYFIAWNKTHLIKEVDLMTWRTDMALIERVGDAGLKLESLDISTFPTDRRDGTLPQVHQVFTKILKSSVDTLTSLAVEASETLFCLKSPVVFKHVKRLQFTSYNLHVEGDVRDLNLPIVFPNLESICLSGNRDAGEDERNFPFSQPLLSVKSLDIESECPTFWLSRMAAIFPNLTHMKLSNFWDFPQSAPYVWSFTSLKSLHVESYCAKNLDESFTGYTENVCNQLRKSILNEKGAKDRSIVLIRNAPSIIDLTNLQELRLDIVNDPNDMDSVDSSSLPNYDVISPVTAKYAFELMPRLKSVEIAIVPYEPIFIPSDKGYKTRLEKLEAYLKPMAAYPIVKLIQSK